MSRKQTIEIARSFSRKLNIGNYETMDFFSSAKEEVEESELEETSKRLHDLCKKEVEESIRLYKDEMAKEVLEGAKALWEAKKKELYNSQEPQEKYNEDSQLDDLNKESKQNG